MRLLAHILGMLWMAHGLESAPPQRFVFVEKQMGADFRIVLYAKEAKFAKAAAKAAFDEVKRLNAIFSDYEAESELSLLSANSGKGKKLSVSEDLWTVLSAAQCLSTQTDGAFDVTVGPCVRLWRIARFRKTLPAVDKIAAAKLTMGYQKLLLYPEAKKVQLKDQNMILDLGGIAKGYAADKMLEILKEKGMLSVLVDAGGDLALGDAPPNKKGWRIEIGGRKHPDLPVLELANCAVATSGDIEQFVEVDGERYSHIIDPRTGIGLTARLQVTVVAPSGMQADSLASALTVFGPEEGRLLIKKLSGVESYFVQGHAADRTLTRIKAE